MTRQKIVIIFGLIILILVVGFVILRQKVREEGEISLEEKQLIEAWIKENDFNQYGDLKETVYIGGTPLFNEATGERIDKYEYILQRHPDKPWLIK